MNKIRAQQDQRYDTEAYNSGCVSGYDSLIVELHKGFSENIPKWLLPLIGGKKALAEALKPDEEDEISLEAAYELGANDGYGELLDDIQEAYQQKNIEVPKFLQELMK